MSYIIEGLYLGTEDDVYDSKQLQDNNVTHVMTVKHKPLPLDARQDFEYKYVYAMDSSSQDILSKFEECFDFIERGRDKGGILVHCFAGVSRSAAVVLAYLMYKLQMSLSVALDFTRKQRPQIGPNYGFMEQLQIFEAMGCKMDESCPKYRAYKLQKLAENIQRDQCWEDISSSSLMADPGQTSSIKGGTIYKCRKCRRSLFTEAAIMSHTEGRGEAAFLYYLPSQADTNEATAKDTVCSKSLFVEPVAWMKDDISALDGKLMCPKCHSKIGSFTWVGERCPCGQWITPAFHISGTKVDESKPLPLPAVKTLPPKEPETTQQKAPDNSSESAVQFPVMDTPS